MAKWYLLIDHLSLGNPWLKLRISKIWMDTLLIFIPTLVWFFWFQFVFFLHSYIWLVCTSNALNLFHHLWFTLVFLQNMQLYWDESNEGISQGQASTEIRVRNVWLSHYFSTSGRMISGAQFHFILNAFIILFRTCYGFSDIPDHH